MEQLPFLNFLVSNDLVNHTLTHKYKEFQNKYHLYHLEFINLWFRFGELSKLLSR